MVSRFEIVDEEYVEELKDKSENENTRKSTEYWKNVFKKWANERNFLANSEEYESDWFFISIKWLHMADYSRAHSEIQ